MQARNATAESDVLCVVEASVIPMPICDVQSLSGADILADEYSDISSSNSVTSVSKVSSVSSSAPSIQEYKDDQGNSEAKKSKNDELSVIASAQDVLNLFKVCHAEISCTAETHLQVSTEDNLVSIMTTCDNQHVFTWKSELKKYSDTKTKRSGIEVSTACQANASPKRRQRKKISRSRPYYTLQFSNSASNFPN